MLVSMFGSSVNIPARYVAVLAVIIIVGVVGSRGVSFASGDYGTSGVTIDGLVDRELSLSHEEIWEMPRTIVNAELYCVATPYLSRIGGEWTGVKLGYLLDQAGVKDGAIKVAFYAADGFTTDLDVETAYRDDIILAYERNGEMLDENLWMVVPGKWGYKWIKWIERIELVDYDFLGYYESSGYSDTANIGE